MFAPFGDSSGSGDKLRSERGVNRRDIPSRLRTLKDDEDHDSDWLSTSFAPGSGCLPRDPLSHRTNSDTSSAADRPEEVTCANAAGSVPTLSRTPEVTRRLSWVGFQNMDVFVK